MKSLGELITAGRDELQRAARERSTKHAIELAEGLTMRGENLCTDYSPAPWYAGFCIELARAYPQTGHVRSCAKESYLLTRGTCTIYTPEDTQEFTHTPLPPLREPTQEEFDAIDAHELRFWLYSWGPPVRADTLSSEEMNEKKRQHFMLNHPDCILPRNLCITISKGTDYRLEGSATLLPFLPAFSRL